MSVTEVTPTERPEVVCKLSQPIATHDGLVSELKFKCPPAKALMKHGDPLRTYSKGVGADKIEYNEYNWAAVFHIASMATGVDEVLLQGIAATDINRLANAVIQVLYPTALATTNT